MNSNRKVLIFVLMGAVGLAFLIKLFSIQVMSDEYRLAAENNIVQKVIQYPYRGLIYDRYDNILVNNTPVYDLMVIPKEVRNLDTLGLCQLVGISLEEARITLDAARNYSRVKATAFQKQISGEQFARMQSQLFNYPGFFVTPRTVRSYPFASMANALGYIGEINRRQLEAQEAGYYKQGDYIGISGLEKFYENDLRGRRGIKYRMVNVRGVEKGSFRAGEYDTLPEPGLNLHSTIDIRLQQYGERLLMGKVGSIVCIEPSTGEILAIISSPSYDPNLLTGGGFSKNFGKLLTDSTKPLFNRPLMAAYRPGSIFKIAQALTGLQEGVINTGTRIQCNRRIIGCHGPHSFEDLKGAITNSCNPYFRGVMQRVVNQDKSSNTFKDTEIGLRTWDHHMASFGFGSRLGIDLPNEKGGFLPKPEYYDRWYGEGRWKYSTIASVAIGEGENQVVPLQMANFACIVANRGYFYIPHLIRGIGESGAPLPQYLEKKYTTIDRKYFDVVVNAMEEVVKSGTGQYRAKLKDIVVCGKTGTVQNLKKEDHSVFIAFAPKEEPKIAVSVYVEYAGQGARAAAGIASLMIEQYLNDSTARPQVEEYILKGKFIY